MDAVHPEFRVLLVGEEQKLARPSLLRMTGIARRVHLPVMRIFMTGSTAVFSKSGKAGISQHSILLFRNVTFVAFEAGMFAFEGVR